MSTAVATFEVEIAQARDRRVYLPIPFDPDAQWGVKRPHRLGGTVDGQRFRGVVEWFDDRLGILIGQARRRNDCLVVGQRVLAVLDAEGPQRDALASDIQAALAAEPAAAAFWDGLPQFYRKAYLRWIDGTKTRPELRAARIGEVVALLNAGVKARD